MRRSKAARIRSSSGITQGACQRETVGEEGACRPLPLRIKRECSPLAPLGIDWDARRSDIVVDLDAHPAPLLRGATMLGTFLRLAPEFEMRARAAGVPRDSELGLSIAGQKLLLAFTRRGFRVRGGSLGRSYLTLNRDEFARMAFGHNGMHDMIAEDRIQASTHTAACLAAALFPKLPFWRPHPVEVIPQPRQSRLKRSGKVDILPRSQSERQFGAPLE